jgi:hypothetical protein
LTPEREARAWVVRTYLRVIDHYLLWSRPDVATTDGAEYFLRQPVYAQKKFGFLEIPACRRRIKFASREKRPERGRNPDHDCSAPVKNGGKLRKILAQKPRSPPLKKTLLSHTITETNARRRLYRAIECEVLVMDERECAWRAETFGFRFNRGFLPSRLPASERWQSGRLYLTRNQACPQGYRGFESLPLRHLPLQKGGHDRRPTLGQSCGASLQRPVR